MCVSGELAGLVDEAVDGANPHREEWIKAMIEDYNGKLANGPNGTWTECDRSVAIQQKNKSIKLIILKVGGK